MRLTESRIAEIKKRKDAATPGPWQCLSAEFTKRGVNFEMVMSEKVIAFPDAEFLENSITDVSDLLAERENLWASLKDENKYRCDWQSRSETASVELDAAGRSLAAAAEALSGHNSELAGFLKKSAIRAAQAAEAARWAVAPEGK